MTSQTPRPPRASTAGSWFGLGVCAWGALIACVAAALMTAILLAPWMLNLIESEAGSQARAQGTVVPPEVGEAVNLALEGVTILRSYAMTMGVSGIAVGGLLFLAGFGLARGSDFARRAARLVLGLAMLNTIVDATWNVNLLVTRLGPWFQRFSDAVNELGRQGQNHAPVFPAGFDPAGVANIASGVATSLVGLAIGGTLIWLAGRPFARDWCAARSGRSPIASPGGPG